METYDLIIIGTGAGGGTLLYKLKDTGKRILVLERGGFLPREKANWDSKAVFQDERYHTKEVWKTKQGKDLHPGTGYWVGGNTKVYGAAEFRLRERDFEEIQHEGVYFGETDHPIPWQTDHLNCWRKDAANAVEAFTKIVI